MLILDLDYIEEQLGDLESWLRRADQRRRDALGEPPPTLSYQEGRELPPADQRDGARLYLALLSTAPPALGALSISIDPADDVDLDEADPDDDGAHDLIYDARALGCLGVA